ncbi:alpha-mannosidase [Streptomonospora wellingtoniae]|uniref:Glycoside hydrolase family 38 C-terminal domain-containing protein n=1 Tax=Streptomonospora wellingtoniae TaxID=3075544 RepID=A0ABU2KX09_9ACTN|nr:glycoside hydrolase family 38 C-terminal domain-containing protein [Streptomonospora sp. DSM 45055]MDT0303578.1 glycoside hydrolase family 38 C-terminal domain-containing protein [Streptomonospora sp. DSM 45055]
MHDEHARLDRRLTRVLGQRLWASVYAAAVPLTVERWDAPGGPVPAAEGVAAPYSPAAVGQAWGPPWGTSWFRFTGRVPAEWAGRTVEAVLDLGFDPDRPGFCAEGLVHLPDGTPLKGLNPRNRWVRVAAPARGGEGVDLRVEAAANPVVLGPDGFAPTPLGDPATAGSAPLYRLRRADLAVFDPEVWGLSMDAEVLGQLMRELPEGSPRRARIRTALSRALDVLDPTDAASTAATAGSARELLAPVLADPAEASAHRVSAVGHAHIDSAWLWPLHETVRKVARTVANATALMEDHPDLVYAMSQAQQYAWLKESHPALFARLRKHTRRGRFAPVGGMWVEADTNMPGSEALARQFSYGRRFFRDELGVETREVWLPDSFGYSAALPQLVRLSGSRWFLTQKLSWNADNAFPHHTFWWEGIDGSRVFTHFPPVDTYNAELTGHELAHAARGFRDAGPASRSLVPFGHGDGGGGPTREMLARAARTADLEGSPRVRLESPAEFFAAAEAEYADQAPVWLGELYLELHRGTYTSQARTKQGNRRSEHMLREAELWAATAAVRTADAGSGAYRYPYERLEALWKRVLLHQFHDILPGSSIAWVHREATRAYVRITAELEEIADGARRVLAGGTGAGERGGAGAVTVFNACPHERGGVAAMGGRSRANAGGEGGAPEAPAVALGRDGGGYVLDNGLLRVAVDARGLVTSVVEAASGREALAPGAAANLLQLHRDLPNAWDAWDVDAFYRRTLADLTAADSVRVLREAPEGAAVEAVRSFGSSTARQVVALERGSVRVDFTAEVDWHERERFLKAAFPLDVRASEVAAEIQFGHVHRPAHTNTSWDAARFEACGHRWVRAGEPGYGHALATASTYGHDVDRAVRRDGGTTTVLRLSLLRAPRFPDPEADQGRHVFAYALVPGAGISDAVREGYRLNLPERAAPGGADVAPLVAAEGAGVVVESVKLAEDRSGAVVVRLYEAHGARVRGALRASFPLAGAAAVDLLEEPLDEGPIEVSGGRVAFALRPFQILTLRLART